MKEMIEKLKARRDKWIDDNYPDKLMIAILTDCMFAAMERLEAMEQPPIINRDRIEPTQKDIERAAAIKALRWAANNATCGHTLCSGMRTIADAITRLENGGEL